jgi:hypothetical protein
MEVFASIMYCPMMKTENVEMAHGHDPLLLFLFLAVVLSNLPPSLSLSLNKCAFAHAAAATTATADYTL